MSDDKNSASGSEAFTRRDFLRAGSAGLGMAGLAGVSAYAQAAGQPPAPAGNDPGPSNQPLEDENPSSNHPPPTDHGALPPIWYSFNLAHRRVQPGGWTHEVTQRELPSSTDLAGVNMRLNAGGFRELHWHTADEWAYMLYGRARVSVLHPDGTVFIGDVGEGDLWYFPAGFPHSIQGLGPDGCEFLLVFDQGSFSEDDTFMLSDWLAHTPPALLTKNLNLPAAALAKLPNHTLYIFPAPTPGTLARDLQSAGPPSPLNFTFRMKAMTPTRETRGGSVRVVDSANFPAASHIAAGLVTLKPGGIREMHWHPNAAEWQFYISGRARMTVFNASGARTMDYRAADVGFVPAVAGHYVENVGSTDLVFLEMFKAPRFQDISLNHWLRSLPPEMIAAHLNLSPAELQAIPSAANEILPL